MLRRLLSVCLLLSLVWSSSVQALGLGDINLKSALNEPFNAEIQLLSVTGDELKTLEVDLADTATFKRYGLDRPAFLSRMRFAVEKRPGGGAIVRVTTKDPVTEPFVTMLISADWARGRLLREYTVLLDPPVFAAKQSQRTAAPAPASRDRRGSGSVQRQAPAYVEPGSSSASVSADSYYVKRSDTLWEIAQRVYGRDGASMNQKMIAIYQANPDAFNGNINRLKAGVNLRIPSAAELSGVSRASARSEVRRQMSDWSGSAAAPSTQARGTLELRPIDEPDTTISAGTTTPSTGTGTADTAALDDRIRALEEEIGKRDSLISLRDSQLAELQRQLADLNAQRDGTMPDTAVTDTPDTTDASLTPGIDLPVDGTETPDITDPTDTGDDVIGDDEIFVDTGPDGTATTDTGDDTAAPDEPVATTPSVPVVSGTVDSGGGILDSVFGVVKNLWFWLALGGVLVAGLGAKLLPAALEKWRGGDTDATGTWEALEGLDDADLETKQATSRLRALAEEEAAQEAADDPIVVVERDVDEIAAETREIPAAHDETVALQEEEYSLEDTFSSETAINLDQSDPASEADFHMAYGLYDQAADLVRNAITVDPSRRDLKAKLAEIYFVWGNKDEFVQAAQNLRDDLGDQADPEWDKIAIMGQQLAPESALFTGAISAAGLAGADGVDLSLDESTGISDLDVDFAETDAGGLDMVFDDAADPIADATSDGLDFQFDDFAAADDDEQTANQPAAGADQADDDSLEFEVDSTALTGSHELLDADNDMADFSAKTAETEVLSEFDLDDIGAATEVLPEGLTSQLPVVDLQDIADSDLEESASADATAEINLDDLGLSMEDLESTTEQPLDDDVLSDALDEEVDPTALTAELPSIGGGTVDMDLDVNDLTAEMQTDMDGGAATEATLDQPKDDLGLDAFSDVFGGDELHSDTGSSLDVDVGTDDLAGDVSSATGTDDGDRDVKDRTMTEAATKLDLARAYIEMGDPDGARSILQEVIDEGDVSQKQEANELLDGLPG